MIGILPSPSGHAAAPAVFRRLRGGVAACFGMSLPPGASLLVPAMLPLPGLILNSASTR